MELRRLVRRLIAGTRLLYRTQPGPNGLADRELLLDLEVDGIRCQLTRLAAPRPQYRGAADPAGA
jgi:hypothetical protein